MAAAAKKAPIRARAKHDAAGGKPLPGADAIAAQVLLLRGQRVLLAQQLAVLYGVETRAINQAVKRNSARFPSDFMFQVEMDEIDSLRSQFVILDEAGVPIDDVSRSQFVILKRGSNIKYLPYAFTEQGIAMLSSVLKSERAMSVNIEIMRTFIKLRSMLFEHQDLRRKLLALERKYDDNFKVVFEAICELMMPAPATKKRRIGFIRDEV
ncbi:MAG: ORF6N domain-containing protein [Betaproteobacteria bacterium]|nr:MAG: ORF6N domain-containing protein [Betaproteobacteria bacterium]